MSEILFAITVKNDIGDDDDDDDDDASMMTVSIRIITTMKILK